MQATISLQLTMITPVACAASPMPFDAVHWYDPALFRLIDLMVNALPFAKNVSGTLTFFQVICGTGLPVALQDRLASDPSTTVSSAIAAMIGESVTQTQSNGEKNNMKIIYAYMYVYNQNLTFLSLPLQ